MIYIVLALLGIGLILIMGAITVLSQEREEAKLIAFDESMRKIARNNQRGQGHVIDTMEETKPPYEAFIDGCAE